MTLLPTIEEIQAEAKRLKELGLIEWESISITVNARGVEFHAHSPTVYQPIDSPTLEGMESAARAVVAEFDPVCQLRQNAEKLGFDLVERGGANE